jgi:23S rRNA (adenine2030-N6)-methyltransferase
MNYRHAYHAGNFADVLKHAVLSLCLAYMKRKEAPFRVIDTHAGAGRYVLSSEEAAKTGEWRAGIGRLLGRGADALPAKTADLLSPYLDAVRALNEPGRLSIYPGSPALALQLLRRQDVLIANELHPEAHQDLMAAVGRDPRAKIMQLDGWVALKALLPPKERRGVILIDPPFEEEGELARCAEGLAQGLNRFATGVFLLWYPIKADKSVAALHRALARLESTPLLNVELMIRPAGRADGLIGCGLVIANPPYTLEAEMNALLPALSRRLAVNPGARYRVARISPGEMVPPGNIGRRRPMRAKR